MSKPSPHDAFRKCFGTDDVGNVRPNFMTPHVHERRVVGPYAVEVSEGEGFDHEPIYGVTVIMLDGTRPDPDHDPSRMFHDWREAYAYVKGLS